MDTGEIRYLGDLQRLEPKPGDMFVLTVEQSLTQEVVDALAARLSGALDGARCIVLHGGMRLGVVAKPQDA